MGVWVRSQSKKSLTKINEFFLKNYSDGSIILGTYGSLANNRVVLGGYKTNEDCIRVLDMIQNFIINSEETIFQMPTQEEIDRLYSENDIEETVNCYECKYHDGACCMYDCACLVTLNESEMAKKCGHFAKGNYDVDKLEETDYR